MQLIDITDITVKEDRQREHFDEEKIESLANGIKSKGLIHPILLREANGTYYLVAGERRLRAVKSIHNEGLYFDHDGSPVPIGKIPYTSTTEELSEYQIAELEFEENYLREDLTWQEEAQALDRIHKLRLKENPKQTRKDTAKELSAKGGKSVGRLRRRLVEAEIIQSQIKNPKVQAARSFDEAFRISVREREARWTVKLAEFARERIQVKEPYTLIHGDLTEEMGKIDPESIDLILADPPYGIDADKFGSQAHTQHTYNDSDCAIAEEIINHGYHLLKDTGQMYIFCDISYFTYLCDCAKDVGLIAWRTPIVWSKGTTGHAPRGAMGYRRQYELIAYFRKSNKGGLVKLSPDVIDITERPNREHAASKPLPLYGELIRNTVFPGSMLLDPCCGSGTIFPAAFSTNNKCIGIEIDDSSFTLSKKKLDQALASYHRSDE